LILHAIETLASEPSVVICGDFNSDPSSGAITYLIEGLLSAKHPEWAEGTLLNLTKR
jgi:endonuclease/exonuclease/phosphatase family metal-dependent hydrolase